MTTTVTEADVVKIGGTTVSGPPQRSAGAYFPALDGYRAVAALSVVLFHTLISSGYMNGRWWSPYTKPLGAFGVAIFFLLSGFLLYRPFARAYLNGDARPNLRSYYERRFFRILPGYWVALAALFFIFGQAQSGPHDAGALVSFFTLTQIYHNTAEWVLGGLYVAWTLCIEISFYILLPAFAFLFALIGRKAATLRGRLRVQLVLLAALYALTLGYRWVKVVYWTSMPIQRGWISGYLDYFALGMGLAVVSAWLELGGRMPAVLGWLARWPVIPLFFAAEFYFLEMRLGNPGLFDPFSSQQKILQQTFFGLAAFFLLIPGVFGPVRQGVLRTFLSSRVMTLLGLISFGIYLWHPIWLAAVEDLVKDKTIGSSFWVAIALVLTFTIASATLSYLLVEAPSMRLGRRLERLWTKVSGSGTGPKPGPATNGRAAPQPRVAASSAAASSASTAASHV